MCTQEKLKQLDAALALIEQTGHLLDQAESEWIDALSDLHPTPERIPEIAKLDALLHVSTHEESSAWALRLQTMKRLKAQLLVRLSYPQLTTEQFDRMTSQAWSAGLVHSLRGEILSLSLEAISSLVKEVQAAWQSVQR